MTTPADAPRPPPPSAPRPPPPSASAPPAYPTAAGHRADWDCRRRKRILAAAALAALLAGGGGAAACWAAYRAELERRMATTVLVGGAMTMPFSVNATPLSSPAPGGNAP